MLKIKDNVDLKELKRYGIISEGVENLYSDIKYDIGLFIYENGKYNYKPKNIYINSHDFDDNALDTLYYLIKDGLVEKVEE